MFETTGLQYTSASKASLIVATIPIAVLVLSVIFLRERWNGVIIGGIGLSLVGAAMLIGGDPQVEWSWGGPVLGDVLMLGAVGAMAVYTLLMKNLTTTRSAIDITGLQICYGALFFALPALRDWPRLHWTAISSHSLLALAGLTLFATIGAFVCFNFALSKISAVRTAIFLNCVPVVTAIGAWLVLSEWLTWLQAAGGLLVLLSVYLTNFLGDRSFNFELRRVFPALRGLR